MVAWNTTRLHVLFAILILLYFALRATHNTPGIILNTPGIILNTPGIILNTPGVILNTP
jgi:hypothetical protein